MDAGGPPSVELRTAVQRHIHQPHHPGVVNLDAGDFGFAGSDRQRDLLKEWEVDVNVQGLRFESGAAIRNASQLLA